MQRYTGMGIAYDKGTTVYLKPIFIVQQMRQTKMPLGKQRRCSMFMHSAGIKRHGRILVQKRYLTLLDSLLAVSSYDRLVLFA